MKPYYDHAGITIYQGHILDVLPQLPAESIQCCVTSPPYWGLRDYGLPPQIWDDPGGCEHEWGDEKQKIIAISDKREDMNTPRDFMMDGVKASQGQFCQLCGAWRGSLGLEPTPELFIQHIVQVFREVKRVLRKDGTLWLNMGDSYAHSGPCGGSSPVDNATDARGPRPAKGRPTNRVAQEKMGYKVPPGLKPKDLCGIPWRVALSLQADGWWLRSDIIWSKPNPMPESVTDRPTRSHEYLFLLTKSGKYFYDADAVREPKLDPMDDYRRWSKNKKYKDKAIDNKLTKSLKGCDGIMDSCLAGRNLRSVWQIATEPEKAAHFATFPEKLVIPCIKAGTSEKGCCPECGAPWVRVVEKEVGDQRSNEPSKKYKEGTGGFSNSRNPSDFFAQALSTTRKTIGWKPSCECGNPKTIPCTVLDPFSGSGKTLIVAQKFGRKGIGIELNPEYCKMPLKKIAQNRMF